MSNRLSERLKFHRQKSLSGHTLLINTCNSSNIDFNQGLNTLNTTNIIVKTFGEDGLKSKYKEVKDLKYILESVLHSLLFIRHV